MTTKNPRDKITWASAEERERVAKFLQAEFGSIGNGLRVALALLLKKHKQPKLDASQWGGSRKKQNEDN
jgi:hypothetical protein